MPSSKSRNNTTAHLSCSHKSSTALTPQRTTAIRGRAGSCADSCAQNPRLISSSPCPPPSPFIPSTPSIFLYAGVMQEAAPRPPKLVVVTGKQYAHSEPYYLFMKTENTGFSSNESLFYTGEGELAFKVENDNGFFEKKVLKDGQGTIICTAKKFPLSLAKWTIKDVSGDTLAKTRTVSGLAKYGIQVLVPSRGSTPVFMATPDISLQKVMLWQQNSKGQPDTPMMDATYGSTVQVGLISAAIQNWSYHIVLDPGADSVLACLLLTIYTDLLEWNALSGLM